MPDGKDIMFPGDASAPAEHVINCRCSVAYETQVDYIGEMLEGRPEPVSDEPLSYEQLERKIIEKEQAIKSLANEVGVAYDEFGNVVLEKMGSSNAISFTESELKKLAGNVFTHNHPGGKSFSLEDIQFALANKIKEIRAVSNQRGGVYTFSVDTEALERSGRTLSKLAEMITTNVHQMGTPSIYRVEDYLEGLGIAPTIANVNLYANDYIYRYVFMSLPVKYTFKPF